LSKADIVILFILALAGFFGYRQGFLMELFFLIALVLGVFVGFKLMGVGADYLHKEFNADNKFLPYLSFAIVFLIVVVLVTWIGRLIKKSVDKTFLGKVDAIAGAILSVVKYAFCISVLIWLMSSFHYSLPANWVDDSWLYPKIEGTAMNFSGFLGDFMPFFQEIFKQF
jgi:membrane protein required for colicin V production